MLLSRVGATAVSVTAGTAVVLLSGVLVSGCGTAAPAQPDPGASTSPGSAEPSQATQARGQLAARVAVAKDRRYVAAYTITAAGKPTRSVLVTVAADASWRVDVQGGALGGTADITIVGRPEGQYQCPLSVNSGCVRVAEPGRGLPAAIDPRVQYPFSIWLDVLIDRQVPLSVALAAALPGSSGACFAIEPAVTALKAPIDAGTFCYADDGLLTAAKLPFGALLLTGQPSAAPATVTLPGPVISGTPLSTAPPPSPKPS